MRRSGAVILVAAVVGLASPSKAQEAAAAPPATAEEETTSSQAALETPSPSRPASRPETEITFDKQTRFAAGLGFGGPIGATASLRLLHGLGADVREGEDRVKAVCAVPIPHCAQGFILQADAGSGGGKLSLGIGARARVEEPDFRGTVGAGLRLSLARTWGSPIGTDPGLTYLGPELDLSVLRVNLNLGVLWRVSGQGGASALFSWGVGFGL